MLTVADFFCGAGGFSEGFRQLGFELDFALDFWKPAINTLKAYHPKHHFESMDILELDSIKKIEAVVPDTDVIIGSPPCVSFSYSNKAGYADKSLGLKLINAFLRIVACKKKKGTLKYWIMENVPNTVKYIEDEYSWDDLGLSGTGPSLQVPNKLVLNASDYGAPQERNRVFAGDYPEPEKTHDKQSVVTIKDVMTSLGDPLNSSRRGWVKDPNYPIKIKKSELTDHFYDTRIEEWKWKQAKRLKEDHGFMGKMSFPDDLERASRTVLATRSASTREAMIFGAEKDDEGGYKSYRLPTIREIACFMSFPITYRFEAKGEGSKYRLVGNAVACKQSRAIAKAIIEKEELTIPDSIEFPYFTPTTDLTGYKREMKPPQRRKENARYSRHIPYMKEKRFRVDLTNRNSDFESSEIIWSAILHKGSGRKAKRWEYGLELAKELFNPSRIKLKQTSTKTNDIESRFYNFKKEIFALGVELPDAETFQKIFTRRIKSGQIEPDTALKTVRNLIDKYFPVQKYAFITIKNPEEDTKNIPQETPLRIAAGLYACEFIAESVNKKTITK